MLSGLNLVELNCCVLVQSGECEVSVAPVHLRATALEGHKGQITLSSLQKCSEKVKHALVDNISTTGEKFLYPYNCGQM